MKESMNSTETASHSGAQTVKEKKQEAIAAVWEAIQAADYDDPRSRVGANALLQLLFEMKKEHHGQ